MVFPYRFFRWEPITNLFIQMKKLTTLFVMVIAMTMLHAQDLPYREIPVYPEKYTAANVAARMVDGLGFRYYWATEGLRPEDLVYQPNKDGRTSLETINHIYDLTATLVNAVNKMPNVSNTEKSILTFDELRKRTLENIRTASEKLKQSSDSDLNDFKVIFKNEKGTVEYPFWNQLNGPIADAIWHVGQIVLARRGSGNPFNDKVSVFTGKLRQ
jgi:hypothetical protein